MSNPNFNQGLHDSLLEALKENGVPEDVAQAASKVVANDDALLPNLGRTPEDQSIVNEAMIYYRLNENSPTFN